MAPSDFKQIQACYFEAKRKMPSQGSGFLAIVDDPCQIGDDGSICRLVMIPLLENTGGVVHSAGCKMLHAHLESRAVHPAHRRGDTFEVAVNKAERTVGTEHGDGTAIPVANRRVTGEAVDLIRLIEVEFIVDGRLHFAKSRDSGRHGADIVGRSDRKRRPG